MQVARIGQSMVGFAIVLFTFTRYNSAPLAGMVIFLIIFPGLIMSPIAGALLDRHGRTRLVVLDYLVAFGSLALLGLLAIADLLPAWLLLLIAALSSLTGPLSNTGLRSMFPLMVPRHLWERVNAVDANGYIVATIVGPPLAAGFVAIWGGPTALILTGSVFAVAALILARNARSPERNRVNRPASPRCAARTQVCVAQSDAPRAWFLGLDLQSDSGVTTIVVPLIILERLNAGEATVGAVFGISGLFGMLGALLVGRLDSRGRERAMIALGMIATAPALAFVLFANRLASESPIGSLALIALSMAFVGLLQGPMDIGIFTIRQRRTDPAWMGRAFAVSISFNYVGLPIGSVLVGWITTYSVDLAIAFALRPRSWRGSSHGNISKVGSNRLSRQPDAASQRHS